MLLSPMDNMSRETSRADAGRAPMRIIVGATVAAVALIALARYGSGKPAYCSDRSNLENSVKGLTSLSFRCTRAVVAVLTR